MNSANGKPDALTKISRREEDAKAALKEIHARRRAQEKKDRLRLEGLIGFAVLADLEAPDAAAESGHRAYICQVLDRYVTSASSRAFVRSKGLTP